QRRLSTRPSAHDQMTFLSHRIRNQCQRALIHGVEFLLNGNDGWDTLTSLRRGYGGPPKRFARWRKSVPYSPRLRVGAALARIFVGDALAGLLVGDALARVLVGDAL